MRRLFLSLVALPLFATAEPITLKGLAPGMTKAQLEEAHPGFTSRCSSPAPNPTTTEICISIGSSRADLPALATFAGVRASNYAAHLRDDIVHAITVTIDASDFEQAEAAVTERYGKPVSRKLSTIKNRMGASFDQVDVIWRREGAELSGSKRASKIDEAGFHLTLQSDSGSSERSKKKAAKSGAKDM